MHVQARLIPIFIVLRRIGAAVLCVIRIALVMTGTVTHLAVVMIVSSRIVLVGVHDGPHVGPGRSRQGHAHGRREGKHDRQHRPKDGTAPACSSPAHKHA